MCIRDSPTPNHGPHARSLPIVHSPSSQIFDSTHDSFIISHPCNYIISYEEFFGHHVQFPPSEPFDTGQTRRIILCWTCCTGNSAILPARQYNAMMAASGVTISSTNHTIDSANEARVACQTSSLCYRICSLAALQATYCELRFSGTGSILHASLRKQFS